jgi:predicted AAA+ superfamily ATPase
LNSLNKEIYLRDIQERYEVTNLTGMEELIKVIASSVGSLTNPQRISDTFKSSGMKGISPPDDQRISYISSGCGLNF